VAKKVSGLKRRTGIVAERGPRGGAGARPSWVWAARKLAPEPAPQGPGRRWARRRWAPNRPRSRRRGQRHEGLTRPRSWSADLPGLALGTSKLSRQADCRDLRRGAQRLAVRRGRGAAAGGFATVCANAPRLGEGGPWSAPKTKPVASCDRTQHRMGALHARPEDSLCP